MTNALLMIVITLMTTSLYVILLKIKHRSSLSTMSSMMIAMALGMMVGLLAGTMFGISYKGNLFLSTVYGASLGIIAGGFSGGIISIVAFLDGILSGLMGGMMGAMLGEMLSAVYHDKVTKLLFVICLAVSFTLIYLIQKESNSKNWFARAFQNPVMMSVLLLFIIVITNLQGPVWASNTNQHSPHQKHSLDKKREKEEIKDKVRDIKEDQMEDKVLINEKVLILQAAEYTYSPHMIKMKNGEKVSLTLMNIGEIEHDLEIDSTSFTVLSTQGLHSHNHNGNKIHLHVSPKESSKVILVANKKGTYIFKCTIPGHAEAGMKGFIHVN